MLRPLIRLATALSLLALLAPAARADLSKLDPLARRALAQVRAGVTNAGLEQAGVSVNAGRELDVFIVGPAGRAELEAAGARVRTELPGLCTAFVPQDAIDRVAALAGVRGIRGAARVRPNLDASVPTTNAHNLRGLAPDFTGLNGAGVLVGDVDSGVDYDHGDFQNPNGTTRLINIWDQTDAGGPAPAGYPYGSEWTPADINSHVAREIDDDGHGTHVLGIAGGDGSATGGVVPAFTYPGVAPKADLVMVKTDYYDTGIIDGVAYIMDRATALGKHAVVNISLGSLFGPKDGTSPFEAGLNALTGPGRIVVVSAGNEGGEPVHAEVVAPGAGDISSTMRILTSAADDVVALDGYYAASGNLRVTVTSPHGFVVGPLAVGAINAAYPGQLTADGQIYVENGASLTASGDREVYVELSVPNPSGGRDMSGTWTFRFSNGTPNSHDETTEDLKGSQWNATAGTAATPGTVAGGVTGSHLLISEVGMRGFNTALLTDSTEFLEIYNPTASSVDLSRTYLCDVNACWSLPVAGTIDLAANNTDFAMKFPDGSSIGPGQAKVIAVDGGRFKRGTGADAAFMFFNAGGGATTALQMTDVATNKGGSYPGYGSLTNTAEFVWLFSWDGASDLVCDVDLAYWGSATGGNAPALKLSANCQDGPDPGTATSCYLNDAGNPAGSLGRYLTVPASGAGTRQRIGPEGAEASGNGCSLGGGGGGSPVEVDQWIFYQTVVAEFVTGNQPDQELVSEPANAPDVISVGAWVTKTGWIDCGGRNVGYAVPPTLGDIADFSSPGPTRDGREKPDLAAPGMGIGSATTFDVAVTCPGTASGLLNDGMQHQIYEGTSMAAPHVTGATALLLQKYGPLTPAEVKTYLFAHAVTDGFTGAVWNRFWGHGKLFLGDLTDPAARVDSPNGGETVNIGASAELTWTATDPYLGVTEVDLQLTRDDGATYEPIALAQPNTGSYVWTFTGPATTQARLRVTARDAAGNAGQDQSDAVFTIAAPVGVSGSSAIKELGLRVLSGNPAPGAARIEFAVPRNTDLSVAVYDLLGRKIATLARGQYAPGRYETRWGTAGAPAASGIYFVRIKTPEREIVKRIAIAQ
jgi:subtilisin family serine protease